MHRRGIRIVAGGVERDVILGLFSNGQLARYDAPSNTMQGSPITVDASGNIGGAGTINGVNLSDHDARHQPGGADSMFPGTYAANDVPVWSGSAWAPKQMSVRRVTGASVTSSSTSYQEIVNLTTAINRTGQHAFSYTLFYATSSASEGIGLQLAYSGTYGGSAYAVDLWTSATVKAPLQTFNAFGSNPPAQSVGPGSAMVVAYINGAINCTAVGNLTVQFRASTGGANSVTVFVGSSGHLLAL